MIDEDLTALLSILSDMDTDARIDIGCFRCTSLELYRLAIDAQRFREELARRRLQREVTYPPRGDQD